MGEFTEKVFKIAFICEDCGKILFLQRAWKFLIAETKGEFKSCREIHICMSCASCQNRGIKTIISKYTLLRLDNWENR